MEAPFRFEFVAAPDDLAGYVNTLFVFGTDLERLDDVLPAYSAQLVTFGRGRARMQFGEGNVAESNEAFFITPMERAAPFAIEGPARACGVSLTALGWAALAHLPVDTFGHRKLDIKEVLGRDEAAMIADIGAAFAAADIEAGEACSGLVQIVRSRLRSPQPGHVAFIAKTMAWLSSSFSPNVSDLSAATRLSERQTQRLCRKFFGKPPVALAKKYRAIRAATLLSQPELSQAARAEVEAAFFDQAHMIRDIRHFTGRTPRNLAGIEQSVTTDTLGPEGYGVVDLFGGES